MIRQLYAPNGSVIIGTAELIEGTARIDGALPPGAGRTRFELQYSGGTDVDWDSQTTRLRERKRLFVDEDGSLWPEDELTLREPPADFDDDSDRCPSSPNGVHDFPRDIEERERCLCTYCGADGDG
jgi:hypothetical protein